jgi:excisionase family DNA binding protein
MKAVRAGGGQDKDWLTSREAARRLDIATRDLYDLIDRGALAAYPVEGDLVLRPEDIATYRRRPPA